MPYTLSLRARTMRDDVPADTRFVPWPRARISRGRWARGDVPRIDRWLRPAAVVHATNYLRAPEPAADAGERLRLLVRPVPGAVHTGGSGPRTAVRRSIARGATVHTSSEFVANEIEELFGPGLRSAGRLVVIPLGIPRLGDEARMPAAR